MSDRDEIESFVQDNKPANELCVDTDLHQGFQLGSVIVEPDKGLIIRGGQRYHLAPKAMEVLVFLASRKGNIVSREQISQFAWGDVKASKNNLTHVISEIRHVLDDHKECPTYIQTIPRKGYRLLLPSIINRSHHLWPFDVNQLGQEYDKEQKWKYSISLLKRSRIFNASAAYLVVSWVLLQVFATIFPIFDVAAWGEKLAALCLVVGFPIVIGFQWVKEIKIRRSVLGNGNGSNKFFYRQLAVDGSFVLIILLIIFYISTHLITKIDTESKVQHFVTTTNTKMPLAGVVENAVAILAFKSADNIPKYFIAGLQEELINILALKPTFKVSSLRATNGLESQATIEQIKNRLGVRYIVEGRANTSPNNQLAIQTTMTDVVTGFQVWSDESIGSSTELLTLYSEISRKIVNALHLLVPGNSISKRNDYMPTKVFSAYDAYLQGKEKYIDYNNLDSLNKAETLFLQAISLDPQFILASSALCQTYLRKYLLTDDTNEYKKGLNACQLTSNNELVSYEAHLALGNLYRINGQYEKSEDLLSDAKDLQPDSTEVLTSLADLYTKLEKNDKAESLYQQAIQLELGNWQNYYDYGLFLFFSGRYDDAIVQLDKVILLNKNIALGYNALGAVYYMILDFQRANIAWSHSLAIEPTAVTYSNLGTVLFFMQRFENAAEMYQQSAQLSPLDPTVWGNLGDAFKYIENKNVEAENAYRKGLEIVQNNALINAKDLNLQAQISRYQSELSQCNSAVEYQDEVMGNNALDPYIYYDLAIVSINCNDQAKAKKLINTSIELGYPLELLLVDPQFYAYKEWLNQSHN